MFKHLKPRWRLQFAVKDAMIATFMARLKREEPPWCHACDNIYSIKHILSECADLYDLRKDIFADIPPANLFGFLRETDLFL